MASITDILKGSGGHSSAITDPTLLQFLQSQGGSSSKKDRRQGKAFSDVDLMKMQYDINMRDDERAYNEAMYERYQTVQAQVGQMQEAGLNPALMYQGGVSSPSAVSSSPEIDSSGIGSGALDDSPMSTLKSILSLITGSASLGSQIDLQSAQARNLRADAKLKEIDANTRGSLNELTIEEMRSNIANTNFDTLLKQVQTEVERTHVGLNLSETSLNELRSSWQKFQNRIASVDADVAEATKSVIIEYKSAELQYTQAQTDFMKARTAESKTSAALNVANTALAHANELLTMAKTMSENEMIDSGYYLMAATKQAEEVKKIQQDIETAKGLKEVYDGLARLRALEADNYKLEMWAGIVTDGVGAVGSAVGSVLGGASGVSRAATAAKAAAK